MLTVRQHSWHLGKEYRRPVIRVKKAGVRYIDETTWRLGGRNSYIWVRISEAKAPYVMGSGSNEVQLKVL